MPSSFTWLDYSEHERRQMLDVIDLFGERETRDELGLGGIRDAFADQLFPGTSTVATAHRVTLLLFLKNTFTTVDGSVTLIAGADWSLGEAR